MRRAVRMLLGERGEASLTHMLVGISVMGVVVGATLAVFETYVRVDGETVLRNETQDRARTTLDLLARELRNLASPTPQQPQAVDMAGAYDIVFQTVDGASTGGGLNAANVKRVRYCLDAADPDNGKLWTQSQTWTTLTPPALPSTSSCPAAGWNGGQRMVADRIVNRRAGQNRPLFAVNAGTLTDISAIHAELVLDPDPAKPPAATTLTTGVFLRNQNRKPVAAFTATRTAQGILLNGSASSDPEGQTLQYVWFDGATKVGTGVTFTYQVASGPTRQMSLKVYDPASLEGVAPIQAVS